MSSRCANRSLLEVPSSCSCTCTPPSARSSTLCTRCTLSVDDCHPVGTNLPLMSGVTSWVGANRKRGPNPLVIPIGKHPNPTRSCRCTVLHATFNLPASAWSNPVTTDLKTESRERWSERGRHAGMQAGRRMQADRQAGGQADRGRGRRGEHTRFWMLFKTFVSLFPTLQIYQIRMPRTAHALLPVSTFTDLFNVANCQRSSTVVADRIDCCKPTPTTGRFLCGEHGDVARWFPHRQVHAGTAANPPRRRARSSRAACSSGAPPPVVAHCIRHTNIGRLHRATALIFKP